MGSELAMGTGEFCMKTTPMGAGEPGEIVRETVRPLPLRHWL
jgi:hypothetical protein